MAKIQIVETPISVAELRELAKRTFGDMIKGVVDIEKDTIALGGELHADEEALLLARGSKQEDLWGFNIYVHEDRASWLEFNSMINIRPSQGNSGRDIENNEIKAAIKVLVDTLIK